MHTAAMPQGGLAIYHVDEKASSWWNQGWPGMVCVCVCVCVLVRAYTRMRVVLVSVSISISRESYLLCAQLPWTCFMGLSLICLCFGNLCVSTILALHQMSPVPARSEAAQVVCAGDQIATLETNKNGVAVCVGRGPLSTSASTNEQSPQPLNTHKTTGPQSGWASNGAHYRVALLQADGLYQLESTAQRGDKGDVWHTDGNYVLGPNTVPNTHTYQGGIVTPTGKVQPFVLS